MALVPYWPYRFERHPEGSDAVRVTRWTQDGPRHAVIRPGPPIESDGDVVDVADGPGHPYWLIETSGFRVRWPAGFVVEPPQDPADHMLFYLHGPGEATIYPQGPFAAVRLADPDALVGPGQTVLDRRTADDGTRIIELAYEHDGGPWWQGHWAVPRGVDHVLIITAQARSAHSAQARAAAETVASSLE
jgi:hypothetical protein